MKFDSDAIAELHAMPAWELALRADCGEDTDSAREFLGSVRDSVLEQTEHTAAEDWEREMVDNYSGLVDQIAGDAASPYTYAMWETFLGVRAWQEDISELSADSGADLETLARIALEQIAYRLAVAVAADVLESVVD